MDLTGRFAFFIDETITFPLLVRPSESKVLYLNPLYPYLNIQIFNACDIFYTLEKLVTL